MLQRHRFSFFTFVLSLLYGTVGASAQAPDVKPATAEDRSLTVEEATAMKFPALDRDWIAEDYEAAVEVLTRVGTADAARLPRLGSSRSGSLFTRLTDTQRFATFNDKSVPVDKRVPEALKKLESLEKLGNVYFSAADRKFLGTAEYVELSGTYLHAARRAALAVNEYAATLDKQEANYAIRMEGMTRLKVALAEKVNGVILALGNEAVAVKDRRRLIEVAEPSLPELLALLPDPPQLTMVRRLRFYATNCETPELKEALQKLADDVSRAVAAAAAS